MLRELQKEDYCEVRSLLWFKLKIFLALSTGSLPILGACGCWSNALLFATLSSDAELDAGRWAQFCPAAFGQALDNDGLLLHEKHHEQPGFFANSPFPTG